MMQEQMKFNRVQKQEKENQGFRIKTSTKRAPTTLQRDKSTSALTNIKSARGPYQEDKFINNYRSRSTIDKVRDSSNDSAMNGKKLTAKEKYMQERMKQAGLVQIPIKKRTLPVVQSMKDLKSKKKIQTNKKLNVLDSQRSLDQFAQYFNNQIAQRNKQMATQKSMNVLLSKNNVAILNKFKQQNQQFNQQSDRGVGGFYKKKGINANFAAGFVDLNPKYEDSRHQRAVKLAKKWEGAISNKLVISHEKVGRKIFNDDINNGVKLSVRDLNNLKSNWKSDYIKAQLKEEREVGNYIDAVKNDIGDNHKQIKQLDGEVIGMHQDFYGDDYQKNLGYLERNMRDKATELAEKAKNDGSIQKALRFKSKNPEPFKQHKGDMKF